MISLPQWQKVPYPFLTKIELWPFHSILNGPLLQYGKGSINTIEILTEMWT